MQKMSDKLKTDEKGDALWNRIETLTLMLKWTARALSVPTFLTFLLVMTINPNASAKTAIAWQIALEPHAKVLTAEEAQSLSFRALARGQQSLGHVKEAVWLKYQWSWTKYQDEQAVLVFVQPILDRVDFWVEQLDGGYRIEHSGILSAHDESNKKHRQIYLKLDRKKDSGQILIRVQSESFLQVDAYITDLESFHADELSYTFQFSGFLGGLVLLFIYNGVIWYHLKDKVYAYYQILLIIHGLAHLFLSGLLTLWLPPTSFPISYHFFPPFVIAGLAVFMQFSGYYFQFSKERRSVRFLRRYRQGLYVLAGVLCFIPHRIADIISLPTVAFSLLIVGCFLLSFLNLVRREHLYFALGLFWFMVCGGSFAMAGLGLIEFDPLIQNAVYLGPVGQLSFFAIGMAKRLGALQNEKTSLEQDLIHLTEERHRLRIDKQKVEEELVIASQKLIQADKLATLGTLVAGIAHDISNPNGLAILGHEEASKRCLVLETLTFQLLGDGDSPEELAIRQRYKEDFEFLKQALSDIKLGSSRIREINLAIRNQSRTDLESTSFSLHKLFEECLLIVKGRLDNVQVEIRCPPDLSLYGRRSQWGQVFMNLLANAGDAMEQFPRDRRRILLSAMPNEQKEIRLTIEDSGPGIAPEQRGEVVKTFYTSKALGKGTGLGLSIVKHIIEEHGARFDIDSSNELGGAAFLISIPLSNTSKESK